MILTISGNQLSIQYVKHLLRWLEKGALKEVRKEKTKEFSSYLQRQFGIQESVQILIKQAFRNYRIIQRSKETIKVQLGSKKFKDKEIFVSDLIDLLNYGNLQVEACPIFSDLQKSLNSHSGTYLILYRLHII